MEAKFDMPAEDYFKVDAASASTLVSLTKECPFIAKYGTKEPTTAMIRGTATHLSVLEPSKFLSDVIEVDCKIRSGKAWEEANANNINKICLPTKEYQKVVSMRDEVFSSSRVAWLMSHAVGYEVSFFWDVSEWVDSTGCTHLLDPHIPGKARIDGLSIIEEEKTGILWDLKTTSDLSDEAFKLTSHKMKNPLRAAWYLDAAMRYRPDLDWRFCWVGVRSAEPFLARVFDVHSSWIEYGANKLLDSILEYQKHHINGFWPTYPDEITTIHADDWMLRD